MILVAEIVGVVLALSGSYILSKKPEKIIGSIPWILFIIGDTLHALVYLNNEQTGMVFNQSVGIILCSLGLFQYLMMQKNSYLTEKITSFMFYLFAVFLLASLAMFCFTFFNMSVKNLEWSIALLAISGTTLMASRHKNAKYVYLIWILCDTVFLMLCLIHKQYAIAILRIVFICINFNGLKNWFMPNGISLKNFINTIKKDFKLN